MGAIETAALAVRNDYVADLRRSAGCAPQHFALDDDAAADAGAERKHYQVARAAPRAVAKLTQRRGIGVVVHRHGDTQLRLDKFAKRHLLVGHVNPIDFSPKFGAQTIMPSGTLMWPGTAMPIAPICSRGMPAFSAAPRAASAMRATVCATPLLASGRVFRAAQQFLAPGRLRRPVHSFRRGRCR